MSNKHRRVTRNDYSLFAGCCAGNDLDSALRQANGFRQHGTNSFVGLAVLRRLVHGDAQTLAVGRVDDAQNARASRAWLDFDSERQALGMMTPESQTSLA